MSGGSSDSISLGSRWLSKAGALVRVRLSAIQWLIICGAALVVAIALGTGYLALQYRERALEVSERELTNSALLLSRHFDQQLSDLQHVHEDVVAQMQAGTIDTAERFERQMSTLAAHEMLRTKLAALPHVGGLNLFDAKGRLVNSSEIWPVPDISVSDRRYFREFTSGQPTPDVIVEPVVSKVTGIWTTIFARKVIGRNGELIGFASRGVEPSQVLVPHQLVPRPELVEIVPGVDTGLVPIREFGADCVMSYRLDLRNGDLALANLQRFLAGAVAAHLGGWRIDPEEFVGELKTCAVGKRKLHHARGLMELDFGWNRSV